MKQLGERLRANNLRMISIKSHLEQTRAKIEIVKELGPAKIEAELVQKDDLQDTQPKKQKKKKKAKKKVEMVLDLDMDDDDPNRQTRFSEHLSPNNQELV